MSKTKVSQKRENPKKNGRPELGEDKKTERMNVMGTKENKKIIEAKAQSQNVSVSSFLLDLGLSKKILPPPPAVNLKMLLEINRIGHNLNTLLVLLQKDRKFNLNAIEISVDELQIKIAEVGAFLIGKSFYEEGEMLEDKTDSAGLFSFQNTEVSMAAIENIIM